MASPSWERQKDLFHAAIARAPTERATFLSQACAGDAELRREVESLLEAHGEAADFLSRPVELDTVAEEPGGTGSAPQRIGPYQILDTIAHGGMGTVYRAVRVDDACRKTVALKLVRGGSRSDSFERRFRQEREVLARLLVDAHGVPELLDFGFAKLLASGVEPDLMPTATVLPLMTPEHASPEQVKGQPVTTAGDVYSLGSFSTSGEMMVGASG